LAAAVLDLNALARLAIDKAASNELGAERTKRVARPEGAVSVKGCHWRPAVVSYHRSSEQRT